jgi:cystathionine beta-synthase
MTKPYTYVLEGIGEDFLPSTMSFQYVDDVVRVHDKESFQMTRRLVKEEGIFAGASCGAAVAGAMKYLRKHDREGMVAVIVLPDSARNYLSKLFNDNWMEENGFMAEDTLVGTVGDLLHTKPKRALVCVEDGSTLADAIETFKKHNISQAPVMRGDDLVGVLTENKLLHRALRRNSDADLVGDVTDLDFCVVHHDTELPVLTELFSRFKVALVYEGKSPKEIVTRIDLIDYLSKVKRG